PMMGSMEPSYDEIGHTLRSSTDPEEAPRDASEGRHVHVLLERPDPIGCVEPGEWDRFAWTTRLVDQDRTGEHRTAIGERSFNGLIEQCSLHDDDIHRLSPFVMGLHPGWED